MKDMKSIGIKPNEVTYTVLIKGFCQEGLIEEALNNLKIMKSESIYPNIRTYNTILRGCLRCGKLLEARSIIKDMKQNNIKLDVTSYEYFIKGLCPYLKIKEAWKLAIGLKNKGIFQSSIFSAIAIAASLKNLFKFATKAIEFASEGLKLNIINTQGLKKRNSVSLFMEIRNEEIEKECLRVSEYISSIILVLLLKLFILLLLYLTEPENKTNRINSVMSSNKVKFFSSKKTSNIEIIQFENIFNNNLPIKLEICSGHGDWIIERAYEDQGKYNWVALEIRFERVYTIFSKMVFKKLDNLMILGGEASDILSHCIQNNTFLEIFINYPDPPVWEQSQWLLINYKFLENVYLFILLIIYM